MTAQDNTRYLVLDTETTGLEPQQGHKIIEIGCVELQQRRIISNNYQQYINPEREIDEAAANVHGYTLSDLGSKPVFADIVDAFLAHIKGATLIIHNAAFDIGFLDHELSLLDGNRGMISDYCEILDTLALARKMHPGQRNSLDALCQRYGVENSHRVLHGALLDAEILADVYLLMTGGQLNLLGDSDDNRKSENTDQAMRIDANRAPLKVVQASSEELIEHQKWLELLSAETKQNISW